MNDAVVKVNTSPAAATAGPLTAMDDALVAEIFGCFTIGR